ncbi:hypothetical protein J6590_018828 [Homalodisca vitripennis]|nr:hypothetical protein J6590_018828 [Homalodisca vitripennis]
MRRTKQWQGSLTELSLTVEMTKAEFILFQGRSRLNWFAKISIHVLCKSTPTVLTSTAYCIINENAKRFNARLTTARIFGETFPLLIRSKDGAARQTYQQLGTEPSSFYGQPKPVHIRRQVCHFRSRK